MRTPSYRHSQPLWALWALSWLAPYTLAASLALLWHDGAGLGWPAAPIVAGHVLALLVMGRLTIALDAHHLRWLYNASSADAVQLALTDGRCLRLGSDDGERPLGFTRARLPRR